VGLFITFEGGEGCGKSTQAKALRDRLKQQDIPVLLTREPGGTSLGARLRRVLKTRNNVALSPRAELLLFAASRAQLTQELIRPALEAGTVVVCDRFLHSTLVYQGYGRGLDLATVNEINRVATGGLVPDLTVLIDMPPEQGLARKRTPRDRFESEDPAFHDRVRKGYLVTAAADPDRWLVIDGCLAKKTIAGIVWDRVSTQLPKRQHGA